MAESRFSKFITSKDRRLPHSADPVRPWWGLGDFLLAVPVVLGVSILASFLAQAIGALSGQLDSASVLDGEDVEAPAGIRVIGLFGLQSAQILWPFFVSRWKGLGMAKDWGWRFDLKDLAIGILAAAGCGIAALAAREAARAATGLSDLTEADNTAILTEAQGSVWFVPLVFAVVIGAPVSEELIFRGLALRAFEKRWGPVMAVVGSTFVFTLPHYMETSFAGLITLWASIAGVGAVLAITALKTGRLGACIVAHILFNIFGVLVALKVIPTDEVAQAVAGPIGLL